MVVAGTGNFYLDAHLCNELIKEFKEIMQNVDLYLNVSMNSRKTSFSEKKLFQSLAHKLKHKFAFKYPNLNSLEGVYKQVAMLYYTQFKILCLKAKENFDLVESYGDYDIRELASHVIFPFYDGLVELKNEIVRQMSLDHNAKDSEKSLHLYTGHIIKKNGHNEYQKGFLAVKLPIQITDIILENLGEIMDQFDKDKLHAAVLSVKSFKPESYYSGKLLIVLDKFDIKSYFSEVMNDFKAIKKGYLMSNASLLFEKMSSHKLIGDAIVQILKTVDELLPTVTDQTFHSEIKRKLVDYHNLYSDLHKNYLKLVDCAKKFEALYKNDTTHNGFIDHSHYEQKQINLSSYIDDLIKALSIMNASYNLRSMDIGKLDRPGKNATKSSFVLTKS